MECLGEKIESWRQNHYILRGLSPKFDHVAGILKHTKSAEKLSVVQLVGELKVYKDNLARKQGTVISPPTDKGIALKIAQARQKVEEKGEEASDE